MVDLPLSEQENVADRYAIRREVRAANKQLAEVLRQWVIDGTADYEIMHAEGHQGHYTELPERTLFRKLLDQGYTFAEIIKLVDSKETSLNSMSADELEYVYQVLRPC